MVCVHRNFINMCLKKFFEVGSMIGSWLDSMTSGKSILLTLNLNNMEQGMKIQNLQTDLDLDLI